MPPLATHHPPLTTHHPPPAHRPPAHRENSMVGNITWHAHSSNITVDGRFEPVLEKFTLTGDATFKGDGEFRAPSDDPTTPRPYDPNAHPTTTQLPPRQQRAT